MAGVNTKDRRSTYLAQFGDHLSKAGFDPERSASVLSEIGKSTPSVGTLQLTLRLFSQHPLNDDAYTPAPFDSLLRDLKALDSSESPTWGAEKTKNLVTSTVVNGVLAVGEVSRTKPPMKDCPREEQMKQLAVAWELGYWLIQGMIKQLYALTCTLNGESGIAIAPLPAKILTKDSTNAPSSAPAQSPVVVVPVARAPASMAAEKSNLTTTTAGARVSQTLNLNARDRSPTVIGSADDPRNPYVGSAPQHLQRQREQQEQLTQHQSRAVVGGGNLQDTKGYVSVVSSSFPSAVTNPVAEMGSPQRRLNHAPPMTQVRRTEPHGSTGSVGSFLSFLPVRTKKWGDGGQGLPMKYAVGLMCKRMIGPDTGLVRVIVGADDHDVLWIDIPEACLEFKKMICYISSDYQKLLNDPRTCVHAADDLVRSAGRWSLQKLNEVDNLWAVHVQFPLTWSNQLPMEYVFDIKTFRSLLELQIDHTGEGGGGGGQTASRRSTRAPRGGDSGNPFLARINTLLKLRTMRSRAGGDRELQRVTYQLTLGKARSDGVTMTQWLSCPGAWGYGHDDKFTSYSSMDFYDYKRLVENAAYRQELIPVDSVTNALMGSGYQQPRTSSGTGTAVPGMMNGAENTERAWRERELEAIGFGGGGGMKRAADNSPHFGLEPEANKRIRSAW